MTLRMLPVHGPPQVRWASLGVSSGDDGGVIRASSGSGKRWVSVRRRAHTVIVASSADRRQRGGATDVSKRAFAIACSAVTGGSALASASAMAASTASDCRRHER